VTLSETFDTFEAVIGDFAAADSAPVDDNRTEPSLASEPLFIEFGDPVRLDPERAGLVWELVPPAGRTIRLRSPFVSLAFHLLPVVAIITAQIAAATPPTQIPVQLVFEQPPPPPEAAPQSKQPEPEPPPPPGRIASEDMGVVKPPDLGATTGSTPPAAGEQQPTPSETPTAATTASPPLPRPKPAPPKPNQAAIQLPKPSGVPPAPRQATPQEASHSARFAGPTATRDEYFAHLVTLTQQHVDLLPRALAHELHGETALSIQVQDDGTVLRIAIVQSCGVPELDQRVVMMVKAVGRFPPLPQWFQGNVMDMDFRVSFPMAVQ
jgi:TonB family protein